MVLLMYYSCVYPMWASWIPTVAVRSSPLCVTHGVTGNACGGVLRRRFASRLAAQVATRWWHLSENHHGTYILIACASVELGLRLFYSGSLTTSALWLLSCRRQFTTAVVRIHDRATKCSIPYGVTPLVTPLRRLSG